MRPAIGLGLILAGSMAIVVLSSPVGAGDPMPSPEVITIPAGPFVFGSDRAERETGYRLDETAYGHSVTREQKWYESEFARQQGVSKEYRITKTLITNAQYQEFVRATGHAAPTVDRRTWQSYGLIHPWSRTRRFVWKNGAPPPGRGAHPVVLISARDAEKFADWLSSTTPYQWRLPTEREWEKAARGSAGNRFPWGDVFNPELLNSHDKGPFDTVPVNRFPGGASPYGMLDAAGQVFEWTATAAGAGRAIVKGGSWDDKGCGVCRSSARHSRPLDLKHILIGFRLIREDK